MPLKIGAEAARAAKVQRLREQADKRFQRKLRKAEEKEAIKRKNLGGYYDQLKGYFTK